MLDQFSQILVLSLGLDGVKCFKKGDYSVWPIGIKFWNLHGQDRTRKEFIILAALIPGPSPPKKFDAFLSPILEEIQQSKKGFSFQLTSKPVCNLPTFFLSFFFLLFSFFFFFFFLFCSSQGSKSTMRAKGERRPSSFAWRLWSKIRVLFPRPLSTLVPRGYVIAGGVERRVFTMPKEKALIKPVTSLERPSKPQGRPTKRLGGTRSRLRPKRVPGSFTLFCLFWVVFLFFSDLHPFSSNSRLQGVRNRRAEHLCDKAP